MRRALPPLAVTLALLAPAVAARAGTTSAAIPVSVVVEPSCTVAASPLTFEGAKAGAAGVSARSDIRVACTPDQGFSARIDSGTHAAGGQRRMVGEASGTFVAYEIFADAAETRPWRVVNAVAPRDGSPVVLPAYGRIIQSRAAADRYGDVVTVSVEF